MLNHLEQQTNKTKRLGHISKQKKRGKWLRELD